AHPRIARCPNAGEGRPLVRRRSHRHGQHHDRNRGLLLAPLTARPARKARTLRSIVHIWTSPERIAACLIAGATAWHMLGSVSSLASSPWSYFLRLWMALFRYLGGRSSTKQRRKSRDPR